MIIVVSEGRIAADMPPHALMGADILSKLGIREPLYVTALKYAGVNVTENITPGYMDTLDTKSVTDKVKNWNLNIERINFE